MKSLNKNLKMKDKNNPNNNKMYNKNRRILIWCLINSR